MITWALIAAGSLFCGYLLAEALREGPTIRHALAVSWTQIRRAGLLPPVQVIVYLEPAQNRLRILSMVAENGERRWVIGEKLGGLMGTQPHISQILIAWREAMGWEDRVRMEMRLHGGESEKSSAIWTDPRLR